MSKNILVVGASGLVGSNILEHLEKEDSKITLLLRRRILTVAAAINAAGVVLSHPVVKITPSIGYPYKTSTNDR